MSTPTATASSSGIGAGGLLGVAFVVLRLTHVIDWQWRWVLAPFWVPVAIFALVLSGILVWLVVEDERLAESKKRKGLR